MDTDEGGEWISADTSAQDYSATSDMVGVQALMISVVPAHEEKEVCFAISNNPRIAYYLETKGRPGLGIHLAFPGVLCPQGKKPIVVSCTAWQLYQLLATASVPALTKFYSVYANVLRFTARAICSHAEIYTYEDAQKEWHLGDSPEVSAVEYQMAVSAYMLGPCYTIRENAQIGRAHV